MEELNQKTIDRAVLVGLNADCFTKVDGGTIDAIFLTEQGDYDAQQDHAGAQRTELHTEFGDMYAREIESFSNSILTGSPLEVPASDAVQVQRVIELAYRSNDEKKLFDL